MRAGDRVGIWSPNRAEWVITQYGSAKAGAILVNINPAYKTQELGFILDRSGVSVLIAARGFRATNYVAMIDEVRPDLPGLREIVLLGETPEPWATSWEKLLARAVETPVEALRERDALLDFDDPINIQYTSGTTGLPQGRHADATATSSTTASSSASDAAAPSRTGSACRCPSTTASGWSWATSRRSPTAPCIVIPRRVVRRRARASRRSQEERCTALYGVPTMFIAELDHPDFDAYDLSTPAHRHHGRLALPGRGHAAGHRPRCT